MEKAWPRPIPYVTRASRRKRTLKRRETISVLLGYDIFGKPFYWSDKTRTMQSNALG